MDKFFRDLEKDLTPIGFNQAVKIMANWCNGNLMAITTMRLLNEEKPVSRNNEVPTMDSPQYEPEDSKLKPDNIGIEVVTEAQKRMRRGDCFASIRKACIDIGIERNWQVMQYYQINNFKEYLTFRIQNQRNATVTPEELQTMADIYEGMPEEDIEYATKLGSKKKVAKMELSKEDLISHDSDYESNMDFEEAMSSLGILEEHRVRVKFVENTYLTIRRTGVNAIANNNYQELQEKYRDLVDDVLILMDQLEKFEEVNDEKMDQAIERETIPRVTVYLSMPCQSFIHRIRKNRKEKEEFRKAKLTKIA